MRSLLKLVVFSSGVTDIMTGANESFGPPEGEPIEAQREKNAPAKRSSTAAVAQRAETKLYLLYLFIAISVYSVCSSSSVGGA